MGLRGRIREGCGRRGGEGMEDRLEKREGLGVNIRRR